MTLTDSVTVIAGLLVAATLMLLTVFARLYRKAGPHEALVVYGFREHASSRGAVRSSSRWWRTGTSCRSS